MAKTLEDLIVDQIAEIADLRAEDRANKDSIRTLNRNQRASFQKYGVVRYNAFKGMGGNLSFAYAMLDYTNSGFILNCVHSREGCYLYLKEVDMGKTDVVLGNEEQESFWNRLWGILRKISNSSAIHLLVRFKRTRSVGRLPYEDSDRKMTMKTSFQHIFLPESSHG